MIEQALSSLDGIITIHAALSKLFGVDPILLLPVYLFVWMAGKLLKIRERFPKQKGMLLAALCVVVGALVVFLTADAETTRDVFFKEAFSLGAASALTYQFFKSAYVSVAQIVKKKWAEKFGSELNVETDILD